MSKSKTLASLCQETIEDIETKPSLTQKEFAVILAKTISKAYDAGVKAEQDRQVRSTRIMCGWKD